VLGGVGAALAVVGWTDVASGLVPVRLGNTDWEFGVLGGAIDALPLGTLGVGLVAAAAATHGARRTLALAAAVCVGVVGALLCALTLYLLSAPAVWGAVAPGVRGQLAVAVGKTALAATAYLSLYVWLGVFAVRAFRRARRGG
jgi:hypothetical protein